MNNLIKLPQIDNNLEKKFLADYIESAIPYMRISLVFVIFLSIPYAILDKAMLSNHITYAWIMRFAVWIPTFMIAYILTYYPVIKRCSQTITIILLLMMSYGIEVLLIVSDTTELAYTHYYAGILVTLPGVITMRLRFKPSIIVLFLIFAGHLFVVLYLQGNTTDKVIANSRIAHLGSLLFMFTVVMVIGLASYILERYSRNNFNQQQALIKEKQQIEQMNEKLNQKNEKIKSQHHELKEKNEELLASDEEIRQNNEELQTTLEIVENQKYKLEEANATKNKFFNIISHDLRSPFNAILGFSNILLKKHTEYDDQKREALIQAVITSSTGAYKLTENLLEWSRAQTGRIQFNAENYDIKQIVYETLYDIDNTAKNKEIDVIIEILDDFIVYTDKEMFKTILRNLVSNAIKFTPEGGSITIKATKADNETIFSIEDTGVGIEKEKIEKLFDITQKTSTLGTNKERGTGLGLLLCKEFVEKHNGNIWVESKVDKGSSFKFILPANK